MYEANENEMVELRAAVQRLAAAVASESRYPGRYYCTAKCRIAGQLVILEAQGPAQGYLTENVFASTPDDNDQFAVEMCGSCLRSDAGQQALVEEILDSIE